MRYAKFLPSHGTIGLIAPSFGCATEPYKTAFQNALKKWNEMGYHTQLGPNCLLAEGIGISNKPSLCGAEVMEGFQSDADCLISCGGGELMCEILPYVDFRKLGMLEPKWFMGFSDNTNLTYLLATLADTASVYGPCAASFGMEEWHESLINAFDILRGKCNEVSSFGLWEKESLKDEEHPLASYHLTEPIQIKRYIGGKPLDDGAELSFHGRLLGGCMDCLVTLLGTGFDKTKEFVERYKDDGIIWFLEACDLNVFSIRRAMWQMEEAGWFQHVKGYLIGRPANGEAIMNLDATRAVLDIAGKKNVPILIDVDLGHCPPMMPLVVGSYADIKSLGNELHVKMKFI